MAASTLPMRDAHSERAHGEGPRRDRGLAALPGPMPAPAGLPGHQELAHDLRRLREKGLLRIRELQLPALEAVAHAVGVAGRRPAPRAIEHLLRQACNGFGEDDFGSAVRILFGLVQGTIGHRPTDLRERAAGVFNLSSETFRKGRERLIIARLADELLALVDQSPAADSFRADLDPPRSTVNAQLPLPGLPRQSTIFTGRERECAQVIAALTIAGDRAAAAPVCAVHGMAGVGKTALAVQIAARLAARFSDGVLYVDLHGQTADGQPEDPGDVLERLLRRLLGPDRQLPAHVEDRAALWSEVTAERQLLLVLDNARNAEQVLLMLPAAPGCGVIITSRDRLTGLDEVQHMSLGVLPRAESVDLFIQVAGVDVAEGSDDAADMARIVDAVADRCGDLPLALRIVAARYRIDPGEELAGLLERLSHQHGRFAELDDGTRSVARSFGVSYEALPTALRRAFLLLSLHPGPGLSPNTAAALLGRPVHQARRVLDLLLDRHLIERREADRYQFHDLVSEFARRQAAQSLLVDEAATAFRRLAVFYLVAAAAADEVLTPHRYRIDLDVSPPSQAVPQQADLSTALAWVMAEEADLAAVCRTAGERGFDVLCWQLAYILRGYFFITKSWGAWQSTHEAALAAARRLGDRRAEAITLNNLGLAALEQEQFEPATRHYAAARVLFRQVGDAHGEHNALVNQAWVDFAAHRFEEFVAEMHRAERFYSAEGNRRNAAITLRGMALGEVALGRPLDAVRHLLEAMTAFQELGLAFDATVALNNLGEVQAASAEPGAAIRAHLDALAAAQACGSRFEAARAQARLGDLAEEANDATQARAYRKEALAGYEVLGAPQAAALRALLNKDG
jgi:tetratricopeptide (TPR) repeat protein